MKAFSGFIICLGISLADSRAIAADFNVSSPGSFYNINSLQPNPTLTVVRGETYTFAINAGPTHPFRIINPGLRITNNNISVGTISWTVPTNAVNYRYDCSFHLFGGAINTVPPPTFRILRLDAGTDLTLRSTGTNNWTIIPQYSTNLSRSNWLALTVKTNRFLAGTNETVCGRPPGTNVFVRLRAQRL